MHADALFAPDGAEPLSLYVRDRDHPAGLDGVRARRFEFSSRGDRVPARLLLPPTSNGPLPVVLLQHGAGGHKDAEYLDAAAGPWVRGGAAVATIDFPLHGERASAKLSERVAQGVAQLRDGDPHAAALWVEFVRQGVLDLRRAADALAAMPEIDAGRLAYASFSLGSLIGTVFCAVDPRPRAAALALAGGGFGPSRVDPAEHVARIAPRPLLFVNTTEDQTIRREWSEALHAAAGQPKQVEWFEGGHRDVPGRGLKAMWTFLRPHLALS